MDEVKVMVPFLAELAAKFENCHREDHPCFGATSSVPLFTSKTNLAVYHGEDGAPMKAAVGLFDKAFAYPEIEGGYQSPPTGPGFDGDMEGYATLFEKKFDAFWKSCDPAEGGSVTLSHGDLRGDNIFFTDTNSHGWAAIDFQLQFKGPVPSDLAYLLSSGTVAPEVYNDGLEEILHLFYDEFQKHTKAYKPDSYPFEKFESEFYKMSHVLYTYVLAMGAAYAFSGAADGKLDPSQPDTVVGPLAMAPELGPSKMQEKDLDPASLRTRMWGSKREPNAAAIFRRYGGKAKLEELPDNSA